MAKMILQDMSLRSPRGRRQLQLRLRCQKCSMAYLGFLNDEETHIGCLAHPQMNGGVDLRDYGFYRSAEICENFFCRAAEIYQGLTSQGKELFKILTEAKISSSPKKFNV